MKPTHTLFTQGALLRSFALSSVALLMAVALSGCGGGSGGGDSQEPDPVVVDLPIAYVKRTIPIEVDDDGNEEPVYPNLFDPRAFNPGAALYVKDRAAASALEVNITANVFAEDENFTPDAPNYDVKDISTSSDGATILFSMRAPEIPDADDDEQPTWNIYEYALETKTLRRVISSDITAERGDDVSPIYLADGSILFASNRQTRSREILLDEGRPAYQSVTERDDDFKTFSLHRMEADGGEVEQISFNLSHDFQPLLLQNGRILFTRWDGVPDRISLYTANPDGTDVQLYFGYESLNQEPEDIEGMEQTTPRLFHPQELPDGRIAAIYMQNEVSLGGDMVVIDAADAAEGVPASISAKPISIVNDNSVSLHGKFASLSPLYDGTDRLLVSWSQCRLAEIVVVDGNEELGRLVPCTTGLLDEEGVPDEGYMEAPPFYGVWIYDLTDDTQLPVVLAEEGYMITEAVVLEDAARPAYIAPDIDNSLAAESVGLLHIRSVYDMDGEFNRLGANQNITSIDALLAVPADQRPARFLRLLKPIPIPDDDILDDQDDNVYGNLMGGQVNGSREILGYTPIEPDGSVQVRVPSDISFTFEVLDGNGRRIQARHPVWITLRPGETRECHGCHDDDNTDVVHGRMDELQPAPLNVGATTAISFANTQRYDQLGTPLVPELGQTMAQFAAQSTYCTDPIDGTTCYLMQGPLPRQNIAAPSVDIIYRDEWSAPNLTPADSFAFLYNDLIPGAEPEEIPAPVNEGCRMEWSAGCRTVINYEYHIQPLWELDRGETTIGTFTANNCLGCHASSNADGVLQVPAGQLQLGRAKAAANQPMLSYNQLVQARDRQILLDGEILTTAIPLCEFAVDMDEIPECVVPPLIDGVRRCADVDDCDFEQEEVLDEEGVVIDQILVLDELNQPIPRTEVQTLETLLSRAGANAAAAVIVDPDDSNNTINFFTFFRRESSSHYNMLNDAELKLISEWLDLNGRYYNNPFEMAIQQ